MRIRRTLPPAAATLNPSDIFHGLSGFFDNSYLDEVRNEFAGYFGVRHVFFVSSGKAALSLILRGLKDLTMRSRALIPAYTCYSVPSAIVRSGMKVALCDIREDTFDFAVDQIGAALDGDVACVITNNLFGVPSDIGSVLRLARQNGAFVVEDAAQAMGVCWMGRKIGTRGDVGFFSLGRGKNITCGSGGIIVTDSDEIAEAINRHYSVLPPPGFLGALARYGNALALSVFIHSNLYWFPSGIPSLRLGETIFYRDFPCHRLSGMEAGLLKGWRSRLEKSNDARLENSRFFIDRLGLEDAGHRAIPYLRLPILVETAETRDRILAISSRMGLGLSRMYPAPVNEIPEIQEEFRGSEFPVAKSVSERILTLPTHPLLSDTDKAKICRLFRSLRSSNGSGGNVQVPGTSLAPGKA